jgi:hypothetical protein
MCPNRLAHISVDERAIAMTRAPVGSRSRECEHRKSYRNADQGKNSNSALGIGIVDVERMMWIYFGDHAAPLSIVDMPS